MEVGRGSGRRGRGGRRGGGVEGSEEAVALLLGTPPPAAELVARALHQDPHWMKGTLVDESKGGLSVSERIPGGFRVTNHGHFVHIKGKLK